MKRSGIFLLFFLLFSLTFASSTLDEEQGVYEYVLMKIGDPPNTCVDQLTKAFDAENWRVLTITETASPQGCQFRTWVLAVYDSSYGQRLLGINKKTAPFALVDRINLFQDENGLHVSIVNPVNILRTVLMEDKKYLDFADQHRQTLRRIIKSALKGTESRKQYGQIRDEGYIGRTMGVMAGGDFIDKIETVASLHQSDLEKVLENFKTAVKNHKGKWGITDYYTLRIPEQGLIVVGLSSPKIEARSFDIVKEGADDEREDFRCPGIAHAAAYPFEAVIVKNGSGINIQIVEAMYRMKMYFEDAGMMAFAANMTMPGSIQDEVTALFQQIAK